MGIDIPVGPSGESPNRRDVTTKWGTFRLTTGDKVDFQELSDMIVWLTIEAESKDTGRGQIPTSVWYHGHLWKIGRVRGNMVENV